MRIADAAARSLGEIFRIFQICNILLLDEWQYILSLVICSIIQHWWLILIVGGWLIVAMLQYVMAAHTDPSPAATSSAAPSHLILLFLHSHILVLNMKANNVLFSVSNSIDFEKEKKQQQQQTNKQVLPAESSGQEAIRSSVCFAHQHKEAVDSLATPTLCPSAHQSFADTKRNVTCSSNGQRKQRADPRLPICSNWQWECRWVGMMLMSPAAGKGQWASEFVRKKLSKCWTLLTAGSVTTHRLGHQDKTLP